MKLSLDRENSQKRTRHLLGAIMTTAGIGHFTFARKDFQAQVPDWFPMDKDFVVLASGVASAPRTWGGPPLRESPPGTAR